MNLELRNSKVARIPGRNLRSKMNKDSILSCFIDWWFCFISRIWNCQNYIQFCLTSSWVWEYEWCVQNKKGSAVDHFWKKMVMSTLCNFIFLSNNDRECPLIKCCIIDNCIWWCNKNIRHSDMKTVQLTYRTAQKVYCNWFETQPPILSVKENCVSNLKNRTKNSNNN